MSTAIYYNNFAELFTHRAVTDVNSLTEFLEHYHKTFKRDEPSYKSAVYATALDDYERYGCALISRHQSVTGVMVAFYAPNVLSELAALEAQS